MTTTLALIDAALSAPAGTVLAIVTRTWGSAPWPAGSLMIIRPDGSFEGSVSGGCIEGDVITRALERGAGAPGCLLDYGVSNARAWEVGLACGGQIQVALLPPGDHGLPRTALTGLRDRLASGQPATLHLSGDGTRASLDAKPGGLTLEWRPQPRLAIIGAVHIAQSLAPMAALIGHDVRVIDPRPSFATPDRFPDTALETDWPDTALARWGLDARTAVVALSHDPKIDDPALVAALASPAYCIAALGSRRTHAGRLERLAGAGFDAAALARIHGPAGLDIGAVTPAEIALSILAQITADWRQNQS